MQSGWRSLRHRDKPEISERRGHERSVHGAGAGPVIAIPRATGIARGKRPYLVLVALIVGLSAGIAARGAGEELREPLVAAASMVGGLWLDALKMTVIPLIVALLITAVAKGAEAARAGRIAALSVLLFAGIYLCSALLGAVAMPLLLEAAPLPADAAAALREGLRSIGGVPPEAVGSLQDFFRGIIPDNVFAAASDGAVLPLVVFTLLFALGVAQIAEQQRTAIVALFDAIASALLVVVGWVLWIAPVGIFALGFALGAGAGGAAFAGLAHYVVLVSALGLIVALAAYALAVLGARLPLARFSKAVLGPQAVAISTRSSLASLPAMIGSARVLGIRERVIDVTLPLAVALFRPTGSAMNLGVALYVASWLGYEPSIWNLAAATAVAAVMSAGSVSLPGEISFITSITPIAMALGVPIAPLLLLVAVEMIPDIFRTLGNVTMDVAVAGTVDRITGEAKGPG
jgi:proton glutamate symport protein